MMILICVVLQLIQAGQDGPVSPGFGGRLDLLGPANATRDVGEFHLDATRLARLARLDQLLALTDVQRETLLKVLREDVAKPIGSVEPQAGPLLRAERLQPILTADQWKVFVRWKGQGNAVRFPMEQAVCSEVARLLAARVASESSCDSVQKRRLEVAARGSSIQFHKQSAMEKPILTRRRLLEDGTLVPLLEETALWKKTVLNTLTTAQQASVARCDARRLRFYADANAAVIAADLHEDLTLTLGEANRLRNLIAAELRLSRPVYPFLGLTHPVLNLTKQKLRGVVEPEHVEPLLQIGQRERKRVERLIEKRKREAGE